MGIIASCLESLVVVFQSSSLWTGRKGRRVIEHEATSKRFVSPFILSAGRPFFVLFVVLAFVSVAGVLVKIKR